MLLLLLGSAPAANSQGTAAATGNAATPQLEMPDDWREMPSLADHARAAAEQVAGQGIGVTIHAWGDPASGGFALYTRFDAPNNGSDLDDLPRALRATAEASGAEISEWKQSRGDADLTFEWRAFRGTARVRSTNDGDSGDLRATMLACFYTKRRAFHSARLCRAVMEQFEEIP